MSYWAALDRARLGTPGEAVPRTRSRFEPDGWDESHGFFDEPPEPEPPQAAASPSVAKGAPPGPVTTEPPREPKPEPPAPLAVQTLSPVPAEVRRAVAEPRIAAAEMPPPLVTGTAPPTAYAAPPAEPAPRQAAATEVRATTREVVERTIVVDRVEASPPPPATQPLAPEPRVAAAPLDATVAERLVRVAAEAAAPALPPEPTLADAQPPPPLAIRIDRIEIRIDPPAAPAAAPAPARPRPSPPIALEDYLAARSARA